MISQWFEDLANELGVNTVSETSDLRVLICLGLENAILTVFAGGALTLG